MKKTTLRSLATGLALLAFDIIPLHAQDQTVSGSLLANGAGGIFGDVTNSAPGIALSFPATSSTDSTFTVTLGGNMRNQIWLWPQGSTATMVLDPASLEITINVPSSESKPGVWSTSGSSAILDSGNVGIGTSHPTYGLDVRGTLNIQDANGSYLRTLSDENVWLQVKSSRGGVNLAIQGNGGHQWNLSGGEAHGWKGGFQIYDQTALASRFAIDTDGNVAIGANTIRWDGTDYNQNTPPMYITSAGKVGIGTTTPTHTLDVMGTLNIQDANGSYIRSWSDENTWLGFKSSMGDANLYVHGKQGHQWVLSGGQSHGWEGGFQIYDQTVLASRFAIDTSGNVSIGASTIRWDGRSYNPNTPPLYVTSSGSVGIGTTTPQAPLDITSTSNDKYAMRFLVYAHDNYNSLQFFDGDGSLHGSVYTNYNDGVMKLQNERCLYGLLQWDNRAMAYGNDEHYRNISEQPFYIDTDRSVNIGAGGGSLHVKGQFTLSGTSLSPNKISNGGLVVTGSEVTSGTTTTIVSTGTNQLVLIPQQGDLSMGSFTAGAQPK